MDTISTIFYDILNELIERYDILNDSKSFDKAKQHLIMKINLSNEFSEDQEVFYLDRINSLTDYAKLMKFLEQEIKGL